MTKTNKAKTNIVVVCWNAVEYTKITLNSLLKTVQKDYFLTIIDNNSTDKTSAYLKKFKKPENCIKLTIIHNKKNIGFGGAINQGYEISKSNNLEYTCLCNNDIFFKTTGLIKWKNAWSQTIISQYSEQ